MQLGVLCRCYPVGSNTRGANVTEAIGDQNMERNQVEGEDVEVCFIITYIQFCLSGMKVG